MNAEVPNSNCKLLEYFVRAAKYEENKIMKNKNSSLHPSRQHHRYSSQHC